MGLWSKMSPKGQQPVSCVTIQNIYCRMVVYLSCSNSVEHPDLRHVLFQLLLLISEEVILQKFFFLEEGNSNSLKYHYLKWEEACKSKQESGLGICNQNLMMTASLEIWRKVTIFFFLITKVMIVQHGASEMSGFKISFLTMEVEDLGNAKDLVQTSSLK